jgi:hypothetical protein
MHFTHESVEPINLLLPPNVITNIGLSLGLSKAITLAVRTVSLAFKIKQNISNLLVSSFYITGFSKLRVALICDIYNLVKYII